MLLGILFGYFYYYSNNLAYPIIAHFINNFFALSLFYFSYSGAIDLSVEEVNNYQVPFFFSLFSLLGSLYFFRLGASKLAIVKLVKEISGLGLKDAKDLVDAAPKARNTS